MRSGRVRAGGAVEEEEIKILEERNMHVDELSLFG